jgi:hypothetical protein
MSEQNLLLANIDPAEYKQKVEQQNPWESHSLGKNNKFKLF